MTLLKAGKKYKVPITLCGEMAGRPLEAMALIGLGFRSVSMSPASIGPVKTMILSLDAAKTGRFIEERLKTGEGDLRAALTRFAEENEVEV